MTDTTQWTDDHFVGGDLALDFANTVFRRTPELGRDLLDSPEALSSWFGHAGLLPATESRCDGSTLRKARELRGLLWRIFDEQRHDRPLPTDALSDLLGMAQADLDGVVAADGTVTPQTAAGACSAVALRAIRLALNPPARPVRACDRCGWFFFDTSRGRRRRWCSMQTCGNQAKAARYRSMH
ncbi:CGNR zinc finger domain-containing protein [Kribbella deserti]|uniref:CGNR zinc finger domain-containing protein n=1 Tax=Kribbella deserti TaxID=1926257 RepID=A0ABV6QP15_9ACTN